MKSKLNCLLNRTSLKLLCSFGTGDNVENTPKHTFIKLHQLVGQVFKLFHFKLSWNWKKNFLITEHSAAIQTFTEACEQEIWLSALKFRLRSHFFKMNLPGKTHFSQPVFSSFLQLLHFALVLPSSYRSILDYSLFPFFSVHSLRTFN